MKGIHFSMSLRCSSLYLAQYRATQPELLTSGEGQKSPTIIGDVFIHRSAKVHPTAKVKVHFQLATWVWLKIQVGDTRQLPVFYGWFAIMLVIYALAGSSAVLKPDWLNCWIVCLVFITGLS